MIVAIISLTYIKSDRKWFSGSRWNKITRGAASSVLFHLEPENHFLSDLIYVRDIIATITGRDTTHFVYCFIQVLNHGQLKWSHDRPHYMENVHVI